MTLVKSQVTIQIAQTDLPKDWMVNDVWHEIASGIIWGGPDFQNHANEVRDAFVNGHASDGFPPFQNYNGYLITVKVYDHGDTKPRPVKAMATHTPTTWQTSPLGPRMTALCLSYYGTRNLPSQRGRIYIGGWTKSAQDETPATNYRQQLINLGHALFDIGGQNVKHVVYSPTHNTTTTVQNYWCNDRWDVIRKRLPKETKRDTYAP